MGILKGAGNMAGAAGTAMSGAAWQLGSTAVSKAADLVMPNAASMYALLAAAGVVLEWVIFPVNSFMIHLIFQFAFLIGALLIVGRGPEVSLRIANVFAWQTAILFALSMMNHFYGDFSVILDSVRWYLMVVIIAVVLISVFTGHVNFISSETRAYQGQLFRTILVPFILIAVIVGFATYELTAELFQQTLQASLEYVRIFHTIAMFFATSMWIWWSLSIAKEQGNKLAAIILGGVFIFFTVVVLHTAYVNNIFGNLTNNNIENVDYPSMAKTFYGEFLSGAKGLYNTGINVTNNTRNDFNSILNPGFEKQIEDTKNAQGIGVYLQKPVADRPSVEQGQKITLLTTAKANSAGTEIPVQAGCYALSPVPLTSEKKTIPGVVANNMFSVYQYYDSPLVCAFDGESTSLMRPGNIEVTLYANYTMRDSGYTRRYYVAKQRFDQIVRNQQDPFEVFSIPTNERQSIAVSTAGPLTVSIGPLNQIQGISDEVDEGQKISLWVSLAQRQGAIGEFGQLNSLRFFVPSGFLIPPLTSESVDCTKTVREATAEECISACSDPETCTRSCEDFTMYVLTDNITSIPTTFACNVIPVNTERILKDKPLAVVSYSATVEYTFRSLQKLPIKVTAKTSNDGTSAFFTTQPSAVRMNGAALSDFASNKEQYTTKIASFIWDAQSPTVKYVAQGLLLHFWQDSQGQDNYCSEGSSTAGIIGLPKTTVFTGGSCSATAMNGQEQINTVINRLNQISASCSSPECVVGKYLCGDNFIYNNYESCVNENVCVWCHNTLLPRVITYAQQSFASETS